MPSKKRGHPSSSSAGATQDVADELAATVDAIGPWRWDVHARVAELNSEQAARRAREEWPAVRQRRAWVDDQSLFAPRDEPDDRTATIPLSNPTLPFDEMGRQIDRNAAAWLSDVAADDRAGTATPAPSDRQPHHRSTAAGRNARQPPPNASLLRHALQQQPAHQQTRHQQRCSRNRRRPYTTENEAHFAIAEDNTNTWLHPLRDHTAPNGRSLDEYDSVAALNSRCYENHRLGFGWDVDNIEMQTTPNALSKLFDECTIGGRVSRFRPDVMPIGLSVAQSGPWDLRVSLAAGATESDYAELGRTLVGCLAETGCTNHPSLVTSHSREHAALALGTAQRTCDAEQLAAALWSLPSASLSRSRRRAKTAASVGATWNTQKYKLWIRRFGQKLDARKFWERRLAPAIDAMIADVGADAAQYMVANARSDWATQARMGSNLVAVYPHPDLASVPEIQWRRRAVYPIFGMLADGFGGMHVYYEGRFITKVKVYSPLYHKLKQTRLCLGPPHDASIRWFVESRSRVTDAREALRHFESTCWLSGLRVEFSTVGFQPSWADHLDTLTTALTSLCENIRCVEVEPASFFARVDKVIERVHATGLFGCSRNVTRTQKAAAWRHTDYNRMLQVFGYCRVWYARKVVRDDIADPEFDKFGAPSDDTGGTSTSSDAPWGVDARIPEDFAATEIEPGMDACDIKEIGRKHGDAIDWVSVCAALGCSEDDIGHVAAMCDDATVNTAWRRVALGRSSVQHITASSSNGAPYTRSLGRSLEQAVVTLIAMSWRHPMQHRCVRRLPDDFRDPDTDHA